MKFVLLALLALLAANNFSQEISISVSAQDRTITALPGEANSDKVLELRTSVAPPPDACLTAKVSDEEINPDWLRKFIIYDEQDSEVIQLVLTKENTYAVLLKDLFPMLQSGKAYSLHTIVLPKDPKKAMEVKIARQLVCKIAVRND